MKKNCVLIIGASSDVAKACARFFAQKAFDLILTGRNLDQCKQLAKDISIRYPVQCEAKELDILRMEQHEQWIEQLDELPELTIFCVGYLGDQEIASKNWQENHKILATNYTGPIVFLEALVLKYEKERAGSLVVLSSVAGERGRQSNYLYGSAKSALSTYLSGLRNRLFKKGVHVITVKPGFIDTQMTEHLDLPKILTASPEKVAKAIFRAWNKKANTLYVLWFWRYIMWVIKSIPEPLFKRMKL